jgi:hypothetical protein
MWAPTARYATIPLQLCFICAKSSSNSLARMGCNRGSPGTSGQTFLKKEYESNPFISTYFVPRCPFVGPLFSIEFSPQGTLVYDYPDYGPGEWTDEEFTVEFNNRDITKLAQKNFPEPQ